MLNSEQGYLGVWRTEKVCEAWVGWGRAESLETSVGRWGG